LATDALRIDGMEAYYGDSHVLHCVSFALRSGELLALLGRNGAGKTTCISSIMGLLPPRSGSITLFGQEIAGLPPEVISRAGVGLVPQGRRIFPSLSVLENLTVARQRVRGTERPWTLERIFELFPHMSERRLQLAGTLSGGEQQMLAIGRALMGNPRVLLLDEPSEGLAPLIVAEVGRTIARLKGEGQSLVLVEQNSQLAFSLADHVVILNTGRVTFDGRVAEVVGNEELIAQNLGVFSAHRAA
jgi:branched-chain amino acid transport system ATP-binding protein